MTNRRKASVLAALLGVSAVLSTLLTGAASAHGTMGNPISRILQCVQEGPENPDSAACKAAVKAGGSWPLYDWSEVALLNANGNSKQIIPDGKLCSAGLGKFKGLDLPRADWPATKMPSSGTYNFRYKVDASHPGTFEFYVTKDGYDPTKPLKWSDLEAKPFYEVDNPPQVNGFYEMKAPLPEGKSGRHLIYTIWQRHLPDSGEAFYTCSDVDFGG